MTDRAEWRNRQTHSYIQKTPRVLSQQLAKQAKERTEGKTQEEDCSNTVNQLDLVRSAGHHYWEATILMLSFIQTSDSHNALQTSNSYP
jgi:hypothetical protein